MILIESDQIKATLFDWRGSFAKVWDFHVSHNKLVLMLTKKDDHSEVIYIVAVACENMSGPFSWDNSDIVIMNEQNEFGEENTIIVDEAAGFSLTTGGVALAVGRVYFPENPFELSPMMPGPKTLPSLNGWENLICDYFAARVIMVLDDYLRAHGFCHFYAALEGNVRFIKTDGIIDIDYIIESAPNYEVVLTIGKVESTNRNIEGALPVWSLIPEDHPARSFSSWTFNSPEKLEEVLLRIKEDVLVPFAEPLMTNPEALSLQIEEFRKQREEADMIRSDAVALQRKQERLDEIWEAGDYPGFVKIFEEESSINHQLPESVYLKYEIAKSRK